ncbi:uncharacterized protein LOC144948413 isoform X2 [Lampetra fluviatilis]
MAREHRDSFGGNYISRRDDYGYRDTGSRGHHQDVYREEVGPPDDQRETYSTAASLLTTMIKIIKSDHPADHPGGEFRDTGPQDQGYGYRESFDSRQDADNLGYNKSEFLDHQGRRRLRGPQHGGHNSPPGGQYDLQSRRNDYDMHYNAPVQQEPSDRRGFGWPGQNRRPAHMQEFHGLGNWPQYRGPGSRADFGSMNNRPGFECQDDRPIFGGPNISGFRGPYNKPGHGGLTNRSGFGGHSKNRSVVFYPTGIVNRPGQLRPVTQTSSVKAEGQNKLGGQQRKASKNTAAVESKKASYAAAGTSVGTLQRGNCTSGGGGGRQTHPLSKGNEAGKSASPASGQKASMSAAPPKPPSSSAAIASNLVNPNASRSVRPGTSLKRTFPRGEASQAKKLKPEIKSSSSAPGKSGQATPEGRTVSIMEFLQDMDKVQDIGDVFAMYKCLLCKVKTPECSQMDAHMQSDMHKHTLHDLGEDHPDGPEIADFLDALMSWKNRQVGDRRRQALGPLTMSLSVTASGKAGAELDETMEVLRTSWCRACGMCVPYLASSLQGHMNSKEHIRRREAYNRKRRNRVVTVAKRIVGQQKHSTFFEAFQKGIDTFENTKFFIDKQGDVKLFQNNPLIKKVQIFLGIVPGQSKPNAESTTEENAEDVDPNDAEPQTIQQRSASEALERVVGDNKGNGDACVIFSTVEAAVRCNAASSTQGNEAVTVSRTSGEKEVQEEAAIEEGERNVAGRVAEGEFEGKIENVVYEVSEEVSEEVEGIVSDADENVNVRGNDRESVEGEGMKGGTEVTHANDLLAAKENPGHFVESLKGGGPHAVPTQAQAGSSNSKRDVSLVKCADRTSESHKTSVTPDVGVESPETVTNVCTEGGVESSSVGQGSEEGGGGGVPASRRPAARGRGSGPRARRGRPRGAKGAERSGGRSQK